ncbi:hypothetical protein CTA1_9596 [Colletotrichum tanaceti]|uniref:Uncharacterized protein n=1 Tax=Colletotrichum tanaceti TaxID=1306861 RepID=A0A4U6X1R5_9PEZI|nr:hypothetical protein CTA1_9596 [Colletotrichum tanaceti]
MPVRLRITTISRLRSQLPTRSPAVAECWSITSSAAGPYRVATAGPALYNLFRQTFPSPHTLGVQYEILPRT